MIQIDFGSLIKKKTIGAAQYIVSAFTSECVCNIHIAKCAVSSKAN